MVLFPWLIEAAKKILFNKWTLVAIAVAAAFAYGYMKGRSSVVVAQKSEAVIDDQKADVAQDKLEVHHDARVRKILSAPVVDADAGWMLSHWPDETPASR